MSKPSDLANDGATSKNPQRSRDGVVVCGGIEIDILERLRSDASSLRVVCCLEGLEINIVLVVDIEFDSHISREIEIRV